MSNFTDQIFRHYLHASSIKKTVRLCFIAQGRHHDFLNTGMEVVIIASEDISKIAARQNGKIILKLSFRRNSMCRCEIFTPPGAFFLSNIIRVTIKTFVNNFLYEYFVAERIVMKNNVLRAESARNFDICVTVKIWCNHGD